jgi:hypothetical protein
VTRTVARLAVLLATATLVASCADTVIETEATEVTTADGADPSDETLPITGTGTELLAELSAEMAGLSAQIAGDGDEQATLEHIDAIWVVARPDIESTNPELVNGIDTTVDMARTAVVRIRPADADKASQILDDLVERANDGG